MEQQTLFKVRDKRNKGWFFVDNEYLNGFGNFFGGNGVSIYVDLCRHSDNNQKCFPSEKTIAEELHLTDRTIRKYLKLFEKYHLIEITKERSNQGKWLNNTYWLLDKTEWIKPEETVSDGKPIGNKRQNQRKITTQPEESNNSLTIPIKNNTNKKKTHITDKQVVGKDISPIETLTNYFISIKGLKEATRRTRYFRTAKELLELADGDLLVAKSKLDKLKIWAENNGLEYEMETCVKRWLELH